MPRPFDTSSRYLRPTPFDEAGEREKLASCDISALEPLKTTPSFASIIWLASKLQIYGDRHPSSTSWKGAAFLGQGATFSVYRSRPLKDQDQVRAIKQPRLVFENSQHEAKTMRQLYSLHLELRVLTDTRIRAHPHIAKLVSIAWEEHPDDLGRLWPSLVMEYADLGTLSNCYHRGFEIDVQNQKRFCFAIGSALHYLHQNGVIHGDVKPDNVLVFHDKATKSVIPKLSDFGFCVLDGEDGPGFPVGTPGWESPEVVEENQMRDQLPLSDVYSFGLLIWYIVLDGNYPFESVAEIPKPIDCQEARNAIRTLKLMERMPDVARATLPENLDYYSTVFKLTLTKDPLGRNMTGVLSYLQDSSSGISHHKEPSQQSNNFPHVQAGNFSLRELRHVGTAIQDQIVASLESRANSPESSASQYNDVQQAESAFAMARCCLESMGGRRPLEAVDWLIRAEKLGHQVAGILTYRVSVSFGQFETRKEEILPLLKKNAEKGVVMAIDDLMALDETSGEVVLAKVKVLRRYQCLGDSSTGSALLELDGGMKKNHDNDTLLHKAARCGDLYLLENLSKNREDWGDNLNRQDSNGQTPLLQACMARESGAVKFLLDQGADASIHDSQGDSPLHWLSFLDHDPDFDRMVDCLIRCGADVRAETTKESWNPSTFKELCLGTPLHRAAAWNSANAVRALLRHNANPLLASNRHALTTPLWLASTFHSGSALQIMLEHLKSKGDVDMDQVLNGRWPLLMPALDQGYYYRLGGTLGRIARHGSSFKQCTTETIQALKDHGAKMVLPHSTPVVSQAILLRCHDIVDTVLNLAPESIELLDSTRKQPPLHFAVQQDRADLVELLISDGANIQSRNHWGISALANYVNYHTKLEIPKMLLSHGLKFDVPSNHYQLPFFGAVTHGAFDLAAFILENTPPSERNAMINTPAALGPTFTDASPPGITILGYLLGSLHQGTPRLVDRLFRVVQAFNEKLDFTVRPAEGETAAHFLAECGLFERIDSVVAAVARRLIESCRGVEVDRRRASDGRTSLQLAVVSANFDLAALLLETGSDPHVLDEKGESPLSLLRDMATPISLEQKSIEMQDAIKQVWRLFRSQKFEM